MVKIREIHKRIGTVKNIHTITSAMEMVASSRFRNTHDTAVSARPYTDLLTDLVGDIGAAGAFENMDHPLLTNIEDVKRDVLLVLTSNRGLCGAYNTSILRVAMERYDQIAQAGYQVRLHVVGKRGAGFFKSKSVKVERSYSDFDGPVDYARVGRLAEFFMAEFTAGLIGGLEIAYMQFVSAGKQKPAIAQILPLQGLSQQSQQSQPQTPAKPKSDYEFHPSRRRVLRHLLPATVRLRVYQCFLDASVAEQMARMRAMRNANENADQMIRNLSVRYNRSRQAQITTELAEIMGGRVGLE